MRSIDAGQQAAAVSFTLNIGHTEGAKDEARFICDVPRGVSPPFDPSSVAIEYANLARSYGCRKVIGDAAGQWVANAFADTGILYETCKLTKSQLYLEAVASFNRGCILIPNHERLLYELRSLERRVHRSGRDSVDHTKHGSDDFANALVGVAYIALNDLRKPRMWMGTYNPVGNDPYVHYQDEDPRQRITIEKISEQEDLRRRGLS